jgi:hypothetical protein
MTVFGLLVAAEAYDTSVGCGSVDPTDPANYTSASIFNDTSQPITVSDCHGPYCQMDLSGTQVLPQRQLGFNGVCGANGADMTSWRIQRNDGSTLGYIVVGTPRSRKGVVYDVSRASHNRLTPTSPSSAGSSSW